MNPVTVFVVAGIILAAVAGIVSAFHCSPGMFCVLFAAGLAAVYLAERNMDGLSSLPVILAAAPFVAGLMVGVVYRVYMTVEMESVGGFFRSLFTPQGF